MDLEKEISKALFPEPPCQASVVGMVDMFADAGIEVLRLADIQNTIACDEHVQACLIGNLPDVQIRYAESQDGC